MHTYHISLLMLLAYLQIPTKCNSVPPIYFGLEDNGIFKLSMLFISFQGSAVEVIRQYNSSLSKAKAYVAN